MHTKKKLNLWLHPWHSHSCKTQTLSTWQIFTAASLLLGRRQISLPTSQSLLGTLKMLFFCLFSALVKQKASRSLQKIFFGSKIQIRCLLFQKLYACSPLFFTTDGHYKNSANLAQAERPGKTAQATRSKGKSVECNGYNSESKPSM